MNCRVARMKMKWWLRLAGNGCAAQQLIHGGATSRSINSFDLIHFMNCNQWILCVSGFSLIVDLWLNEIDCMKFNSCINWIQWRSGTAAMRCIWFLYFHSAALAHSLISSMKSLSLAEWYVKIDFNSNSINHSIECLQLDGMEWNEMAAMPLTSEWLIEILWFHQRHSRT